jgi:hypothetical protein
MNNYRIHYDNWTTKQFLDSGDPRTHVIYQARTAAGAMRKFYQHHYGYTADRIERINLGHVTESIDLQEHGVV